LCLRFESAGHFDLEANGQGSIGGNPQAGSNADLHGGEI